MRVGIMGAGAMATEVKKMVLEKVRGGDDIAFSGMYEPLGGGEIDAAFEEAPDVLIDFSNPANINMLCDYAERKRCALVIATTGCNDDQKERIRLASLLVPVVYSANYSLGINVVKKVVAELSDVIGEDFDIEIVERHHRRKVDAPSGTAILLADAINESGKYDFTYGRYGSSRRKPLEIGVHAVRGGGIVGDHSVIFAGDDEVIEVSHSAGSRKIFAAGALRAAEFVTGVKPGLYDMEDVLWDRNVR